MPNNGYSTSYNRMNPDGPTGVQRLREAQKSLPNFHMNAKCASEAETVGGQFRKGGWDLYEIPDGNTDTGVSDLHKFLVPGGDANMDGRHVVADYPGGTVA